MTGFFAALPRDLDEAARIDGAGHLQVFWRTMLPRTRPAIAAVVILNGVWISELLPYTASRDDGGENTMSRAHAPYMNRIVQDPAILAGKPVVKGTRIPVDIVLEYLAHNPDFDELFADYPRLTIDDVKACFAFAQTLVNATPRPHEATAPTAP